MSNLSSGKKLSLEVVTDREDLDDNFQTLKNMNDGIIYDKDNSKFIIKNAEIIFDYSNNILRFEF